MGAMTTHPGTLPVRLAWSSPFKAPSVLLGDADNEQLIADATRVVVDCPAGEAPKIFLEFADQPGVEDLQLEGVVHIVREIAADPLLAVQEFLDAIDANELNKATLQVMEFGPEDQFADAALRVLRGWARGDQPGERTP